MKPYLMVLAVFALIASFALVPDVYAQYGGGMPGGGGMGGAGMGGGPRHGERGKGREGPEKTNQDKSQTGAHQEPMGSEQLAYHLSILQVDLQLTPEQGPLWKAFVDQLVTLASDMARQRSRLHSASAVATEGLETHSVKRIAMAVDIARNRLTALEDVEASSRALYQSLRDDQKTLANTRMGVVLGPLLKG